jgi:hypothetical protein
MKGPNPTASFPLLVKNYLSLSVLNHDGNIDYKSYINKYCMGYNWLAGITLLLATNVDISLLKNYLRKMQSGFYMLMWVGQRTVQQVTLNL